jgi:hypothetical protein
MTGADIIVGWVRPAADSAAAAAALQAAAAAAAAGSTGGVVGGGAAPQTCSGLTACDVELLDAFAPTLSQPIPDTSLGGAADVELLDAALTETYVSITFRRRTTTLDVQRDADLVAPAYVLWA